MQVESPSVRLFFAARFREFFRIYRIILMVLETSYWQTKQNMARRAAVKNQGENESRGTTKVETPTASSSAEIVTSLSLEKDELEPLAVMTEDPDERHKVRVKAWKDSPFACGLTEPDWVGERTREPYEKGLLPDDTGCLCCSAWVCPLLSAGRVGNMAVLKSKNEWVEEVTEDEETGDSDVISRFSRPRLQIVLGPYWPMLVFVTYPLILSVSAWTFWSGIRPGNKPLVTVFLWIVLTTGLIVALTLTACRDPGILYRSRKQYDANWRWTDQADSYRPRDAWFDTDTAVVVEGFDHT